MLCCNCMMKLSSAKAFWIKYRLNRCRRCCISKNVSCKINLQCMESRTGKLSVARACPSFLFTMDIAAFGVYAISVFRKSNARSDNVQTLTITTVMVYSGAIWPLMQSVTFRCVLRHSLFGCVSKGITTPRLFRPAADMVHWIASGF
jgi:hypothetical protein